MAAFLALHGGGKTHTVPPVRGLSEARAQATLQNASFHVTVSSDPNSTQPDGTVVSQSPASGTSLPSGSNVTIKVSGGGKTHTVPPVRGLSEARAQATLQNASFHVTVSSDPNSTQPDGTVVSQSPASGTSLPSGSNVTIKVSGGGKTHTVPPVRGLSEARAQATLQNASFHVTVSSDPNSTQPDGTVVSQSPASGTSLPSGSNVTIKVSGGTTTVPNVIGLSSASATEILQSAGFNVQIETGSGPTGTTPGTVFAQSPEANTAAAPGATVTIFVEATS